MLEHKILIDEDTLNKISSDNSFVIIAKKVEKDKVDRLREWMKKEEIYLNIYKDFNEANTAIFEYIESWYNRKRIHSALGYKTPQQVEDEAIRVA